MAVIEGRVTEVGGTPVVRTLPRRDRRTVGAWCFVDHFGPVDTGTAPMQVGPHPHLGLHTVTWLFAGEVVHRDSLGSEQPIRPGQLNLMTAGRGVAHAEQTPSRRAGSLHGMQLWVAMPDSTRAGAGAFEHHASLPELEFGAAVVTLLVGELGGARSPARADTSLVGADLAVQGTATVPLDPRFEHGLVVAGGSLQVEGTAVAPGRLAYLAPGRDELHLDAGSSARALLLGGPPLGEQLFMWWNFVGRSPDELTQAYRQWNEGHERFGIVDSTLARIAAPRPPWLTLS